MISSIGVHSVPLGLFGISIAHWPFLKVYHTCGCNDEPVMSIIEHPAIVGENQTSAGFCFDMVTSVWAEQDMKQI